MTSVPEPEPSVDSRPSAVLGAPLLDLRHEEIGRVRDLLLGAADGHVGRAVMEPALDPGLGVFLAREQWIWHGKGRCFLARQTREELLALDLRRSPIADLGWMVEGDPVPLESDPFEGREVERFSGEVTQVEDVAGRFLFFELRDPENHFRRVYVAPRNAIASAPAVGKNVEVEGVPTRDEHGALWIAAGIRVGEEQVDLRNASGDVPWPGILGHFQGRWLSAFRLLGASARTPEGLDLPVMDVWMSGDCVRVEYVVLGSTEPGGPTFAVRWSALSWVAQGMLRTTLTLQQLQAQESPAMPRECIALSGALAESRPD